MRRRLLLSYLSIVAAVLILLEVPLGVLAGRHEKDQLDSQAAQEAVGLSVAAGEDLEHGRTAELQTLVQQYHLRANREVLVTSASGNVAVDSDNDAAADPGELRPDVVEALKGRTVLASSSDEGQPVALAAVPVRPDPAPGEQVSAPNGVLILTIPAGATLARIRDVWIGLAIFAVGVLALASVIGALVARSVTRPLAALERAVERLGEGQLQERVPIDGPEELRALGTRINQMAARLRELLSAQSRFVADASHQLRTPLAAARLRLDNLEAELSGPAATSVADVNLEVQRLTRIVDGLLTLSRADGDRPERESVDVNEIIHQRGEIWQPLAEERGIPLSIRTSGPTPVRLSLVPGDLDQILDNLLANALDWSPTGAPLVLESRREGSRLVVALTDHGPGMDPEARAHAFDRFWQGPGRRNGTTGLGLAIVRQLAARNDATVVLKAAPEPPGLMAEIHLPG